MGTNFTMTATSGSISGTASVTVTDFKISVSPTSQSDRRGNTATYTVTITPMLTPVESRLDIRPKRWPDFQYLDSTEPGAAQSLQ